MLLVDSLTRSNQPKLMEIHPTSLEMLPSIHDGATLFGTMEWAGIYEGRVEAFKITGKADLTIGTFLLFRKSKMGLRYCITPPFAPHIGLMGYSESQKVESQQSFWKGLHQTLAEFLRKQNDALLDICLSTSHTDSQPYTWTGFQVKPRHTYLIDLSKSQDELMSSMSPERRKNIRKGKDDGLRVEVCADKERFRKILLLTIERQGIRLDNEIMNALLNSQLLIDHRTMYICVKEGEDIAGGIVVWDQKRSYYLMGGYDPEIAHEGGGASILWQAMLDAKERGNTIFDFEGSMIPEIERFFRGFGGKIHTFFSIEKKSWLGHLAKLLKS
jgi:hypothetical protein